MCHKRTEKYSWDFGVVGVWENHLFQIAGATTDEKTRDFENYKEQRNKKTKDITWKFEDQWRLRLLEYLNLLENTFTHMITCERAD